MEQETKLEWDNAYHTWRIEGTKIIRELVILKKPDESNEKFLEQSNNSQKIQR